MKESLTRLVELTLKEVETAARKAAGAPADARVFFALGPFEDSTAYEVVGASVEWTWGIARPDEQPTPLTEFTWFAPVHAALHRLWTKSVGAPTYEKAEWAELEHAILELGRRARGDETR
jgi:hypothetical protein